MKRTSACLFGSIVMTSWVAVGGCQPEQKIAKETSQTQQPVEAAPVAVTWSKFDVGVVPVLDDAMVEKGRKVFEENCASCHGDNGDAKGPCAPFLVPHPRDFTTGIFRFKTTMGGDPPSDTDLFRTISVGLNATAMPPWRYLLSDEERWAVVAFIKTFAKDAFEVDPEDPVEKVEIGSAPATPTAANLSRGKALYEEAQCGKCHGPRGYGDGPSSATLEDSFGNPISPRNFHRAGDFKRGHVLAELALTIHTGNNGTPMPAYHDSYTAEEVWDLAAYVQSFADKGMRGGGAPASDKQGADLGEPDVVIKLIERKWKFIPNLIRVKQGQLVRVDFQPTDNGLGVGHGFSIDGYDKSVFINGALVQRPKSVTFRADKAGQFTFYCATQCSTGPLHPQMNGTFIVEAATN